LKNKIVYSIILLFACCTQALAWDWWPLPMAKPDTCRDSVYYVASIRAIGGSGSETPTLFQHNTYGEISTKPFSSTISAGIIKPPTRPSRWFDYDFGVVLSGRFGGGYGLPNDITGFFSQLYAHARLYIVDITAGIQPKYRGAGDAELSSGSLLFSNNAHPIPQVRIGIEQWTAFPGLYGYLEVKGGFAHGWLADNYQEVTGTLMHHKYLGGRIGGKLPVNISYEFHHAAQWGGYSTQYGDLGNNWKAFKAAVLVQSGGSMPHETLNAQGNHIAFQQLALDVKGKGWKVSAYWQAINEDGPIRIIGNTMNRKDGLWGVSAVQSRWPFIQGVTYEFLHTTDQSGPYHDKDGIVYGGGDNYYCNGIYTQGWRYFGRNIGTSFLTQDNTRVRVHHAGIRGDIYGFQYRVMVNHAKNFGMYTARKESQNTAFLVEVKKHVKQAWNMDFGVSLAGDFGSQYGNRFGAMVTISKRGIISAW